MPTEVSERSLLLPQQDRQDVQTKSSRLEFLKWHASSPLPEFSSPSELPTAYVMPLSLQCIITGLADSAAYTLTKSWLGFMTGNLVQVVIYTYDAVLPSESNHASRDEVVVKLVACASAIVGYTVGCQVTALIMERLLAQRHRRVMICAISIWRSLLTLTIVLLSMRFVSFRLQESLGWLMIGLLSTSLGSQATYSIALATPFSNTVVFTATMTEIASDPYLPLLQISTPNKFRLLSIFGLLKGAALSQSILKVMTKGAQRNTYHAVRNALFVVAAMELSLAVAWYCCGISDNWARFKERKRDSCHGVETHDGRPLIAAA